MIETALLKSTYTNQGSGLSFQRVYDHFFLNLHPHGSEGLPAKP